MQVVHNAPFTLEAINSAIERMAKSQASAAKDIGRVIVMALWQANSERSADTANALIKNLRKGVKKAAIVDLLETMGNLAYTSGTFQFFDAGKGYSEDEARAIKVAAASWETFKKVEVKDESVDAIEEFDAFVQKMVKKAAKVQLNHADFLPKLQALLGSVKADILLED